MHINKLILAMFILSLTVSGVKDASRVEAFANTPTNEIKPKENPRVSSILEQNSILLIEASGRSHNVVLLRLINIHSIDHAHDLSFKAFINEFIPDALKKNLWHFPVNSPTSIMDPKTKDIPKILAPFGVSNNKIATTDALEIQRFKRNTAEGNKTLPDYKDIESNSLIWLPHPYIIAGSFHKEMYPHDSSAAIWGILELAKKDELFHRKANLKIMKEQLEDFRFETRNFGFPLNGNRGYYLTRSQTNIIPTNVLQYYQVSSDEKWLKHVGIPLAEDTFKYWLSDHAKIQTPNGDGYRWIAEGNGPCREVMESHEEHNFYYFKVLQSFIEFSKMNNESRPSYAQGFNYNKVIEIIPTTKANELIKLTQLTKQNIGMPNIQYEAYLLNKSANEFDENEPILKINGQFYKLTKFYYKNDRANRVSGYDTNHLYGPFNGFAYDFISADHNILLYKSAKDIAELKRINGDEKDYLEYEHVAKNLKEMIFKTLWDSKTNMFYEYDSDTKELKTNYPFLSSAYALWAGIFDVTKDDEKQKLLKMVKFIENEFEGPAGLYASGIETGLHWDKPYVWPVQQQYVVAGLRDYAKKLYESGDDQNAEHLTLLADRVSIKYLLANYSDWLGSNGKQIGEKVLLQSEDLLTGYKTGNNYTWNLTAVTYLYKNLSKRAKDVFDSLID